VVLFVVLLPACLTLIGCGKPGDKTAGPTSGAKPIPEAKSVFKSPAELFAGIPEDARPLGGANGAGQRQAANTWIAQNRAGHRIEWTATIQSVSNKEGMVHFSLEGVKRTAPGENGRSAEGWAWEAPFAFAPEKCQTMITGIECGLVDARTAQKLAEWQGKKALLQGLITRIEFFDGDKASDTGALLYCRLEVALRLIDGYAPPLKRPSMKPGG
jgi:hypothetical protein